MIQQGEASRFSIYPPPLDLSLSLSLRAESPDSYGLLEAFDEIMDSCVACLQSSECMQSLSLSHTHPHPHSHTHTHTHTHTLTVIPTPLRVQMVRCVMLLLPDENRYALQHLLTLLEDISERTHLNQVCVCVWCVWCVCVLS